MIIVTKDFPAKDNGINTQHRNINNPFYNFNNAVSKTKEAIVESVARWVKDEIVLSDDKLEGKDKDNSNERKGIFGTITPV